MRRRKGLPSSAIRKHNRKRHVSSIEKLVAAWLKTDGIRFRTEVKVGKCHVDVVINKRTAIELNGCYYHYHTKCYTNQNSKWYKLSHSKRATLKHIADQRRLSFLVRRGYSVYVFWECELLTKPDETREKIRQLARQENKEGDYKAL